jgi:L-ascorbate metabolism protein UlaG (beta-lactamase superfamily)
MKHTRTKLARMAAAIDSPEGRIYFAGDSAYGRHFRTIYEKYGAPRISLLPIGAYEPRWFMYRMSQLFSWPRLPPSLSRLIDCR